MDQEYFKIELDVNAPDTASVDEEYEYRFSFALKGDPIISEIHAEFYINSRARLQEKENRILHQGLARS
jgi:hypothetical protein